MGLNWGVYRLTASAASFILALLYLGPLKCGKKFYKLPVVILFITLSYFQTKTQVWSSEVPYFYSYFMVFIFTISLKTSFINSILFCIVCLLIQYPVMLESGVSTTLALSGIITTSIAVLTITSSYAANIEHFLLQKENIEAQKKMIDSEKEKFTLQRKYIQSIEKFLPRVIGQRIQHLTSKNLPVENIINSVLAKKERFSTILMCDIREYTKFSKDVSYIKKIVYPAMKSHR